MSGLEYAEELLSKHRGDSYLPPGSSLKHERAGTRTPPVATPSEDAHPDSGKNLSDLRPPPPFSSTPVKSVSVTSVQADVSTPQVRARA